ATQFNLFEHKLLELKLIKLLLPRVLLQSFLCSCSFKRTQPVQVHSSVLDLTLSPSFLQRKGCVCEAEAIKRRNKLPVMAEMMLSAVVQEAVSRGISFLLDKREEQTSEAHIMGRLEMAVSDLELALERSAKLPITDVSPLQRRKMIKCAYVEAMELLDQHKEEAAPAACREQIAQGVKRKRSWIIRAKNLSATSSTALNTGEVRRFEWFADCASQFLRDVESGCSIRHYTFCNPIVWHLLQGKHLKYNMEQGNQLRRLTILIRQPVERGVEAVLRYRYVDSTTAEKCFFLLMFVRLSESTEIVQTASKGLQLLTSQFKLAAESAMGELTLLPNLPDVVLSDANPGVGFLEYTKFTQHCRPDPTCCKASRYGPCGSNIIPSEFSTFSRSKLFFGGFIASFQH
ncbi:hypothetical protein U9M48_031001, partial [Paspalum notatum var. saurae]